jgi:hypothetical protein
MTPYEILESLYRPREYDGGYTDGWNDAIDAAQTRIEGMTYQEPTDEEAAVIDEFVKRMLNSGDYPHEPAVETDIWIYYPTLDVTVKFIKVGSVWDGDNVSDWYRTWPGEAVEGLDAAFNDIRKFGGVFIVEPINTLLG